MTTEARPALRDFALKASSLPLEKACRLIIVAAAAPALGVAAFGAYQFAVTVTAFLASGTELGLSMWTTRALAAADARSVAPIVIAGVRFRSLTGVAFLVLVGAVALTLGAADRPDALLVFGLAALASSFVDYAGAALRGCGEFASEATVNATRALLSAAFALIALRVAGSLMALAVALALGAGAGALFGLAMLRHRAAVGEAAPASPQTSAPRIAVAEVLPLWLTGLLSSLYFRCDILLLRYLAGDAEVGAYGAAYRVLEALTIVPTAVMSVAFPRLVREHAAGRSSAVAEARLVGWLFAAGLVCGSALYAGGGRLVLAVFGSDFESSMPSLRILALSVPVLFANFALSQFLFVRSRERAYLRIVVVLFVVNVGVNLVAIPRLGGPGAAWATLVAEIVRAVAVILALRLVQRSRDGLRHGGALQ